MQVANGAAKGSLDLLKMGFVDCAGFNISLSENQEFENYELINFDVHPI